MELLRCVNHGHDWFSLLQEYRILTSTMDATGIQPSSLNIYSTLDKIERQLTAVQASGQSQAIYRLTLVSDDLTRDEQEDLIALDNVGDIYSMPSHCVPYNLVRSNTLTNYSSMQLEGLSRQPGEVTLSASHLLVKTTN